MGTRKVTIDTTGEEIAADNPKRTSLLIVNNGANVLFIGQDPPTGANPPNIPIQPNGSLSIQAQTGDEPWTTWWGQTSVGSDDVRVAEQFGIAALRRPDVTS